MATRPQRPLILGSTSTYRKQLLTRFGIPFEVSSPDVDETPKTNECARTTAARLSLMKAQSVARLRPEAIVIGSDQVAEWAGQQLGKPGTHTLAIDQLRAMSGQMITFHCAVSVVCLDLGFEASDLATVEVRFRQLNDNEIEHYLSVEKPYDCAGSAKSEGLGITLLDEVRSDDPTALIGLPLIRTARLLRSAGLSLPLSAQTPSTAT